MTVTIEKEVLDGIITLTKMYKETTSKATIMANSLADVIVATDSEGKSKEALRKVILPKLLEAIELVVEASAVEDKLIKSGINL